ncbi:hypothetical protein Tco_1169375 [Tanacetum coccineum]
MVKRSMVDLDENDEDEEQSHQCIRWIRKKENFLCQCWNKTSDKSDIEADRNEDSFLGQIMQHFNNAMYQEEAETESNVWDNGSEDVNPFGGRNPGFHDDHYDNPLLTKETESEPIIWDIRDEEEEYPFVTKYLKDESMLVYDTDIEDVIEEEKRFIGKGGFGREEGNIEDVVVVANDICSSMTQTILSVDFEEDQALARHPVLMMLPVLIFTCFFTHCILINTIWQSFSVAK